MQLQIAILVGILFACSTYLVLHKNLVSVLLGFLLLSNAANLFVLAMSGSPKGKSAPIIGASHLPMVDPLPQALVLTAIVIGYGLLAYMIFLVYRIVLDRNTAQLDKLYERRTKREEEVA